MKKKVKQYAQHIENGTLDRRQVLKDFSRMLDNQVEKMIWECLRLSDHFQIERHQNIKCFDFYFQIEKIVLFLLEQQGLLAGRLAKLGEQHNSPDQQPDIAKISQLREAYREVGLDLLKLLYFVEINAIGLRKILKKFDKRFGYHFTDYYVKTRANHPYSQLQQVFKHVVSKDNQSITFMLLRLEVH